jgi:hypothetical protein
MKILFASFISIITFNVFATSICPHSEQSIDLKLSDVQNVFEHEKKEFLCDNLDLISGNELIGAGKSVVVDSNQKTAQELIQQGYPPFEKVAGLTFKLAPFQNEQNLRFISDDKKTVFQLTGENSGVLTLKVTIAGEERTEAYNCKVQE